ncbi:sugar ABC transporter substrate-binding protein [Lachnospiraceae bacterium ZAX-1]
MKKKLFAKRVLLGLGIGMTLLAAGCGKKDAAETETPAVEADEVETPAVEADEAETQATDDPATKDPSDMKISAVLKTLNSEYWGKVRDGIQAAADDLGVTVTILGANDETQITEQVTILEEQLSLGLDALIVSPLEESAVSGALAPYAGTIPMLFVDTDSQADGKIAFIGSGNIAAAMQGGEYIGNLLKEGDKVVLLGGQQGEATSSDRLKGFEAGLKKFGVEVLEIQYGKNVADQAMAVMEDLLTKFPGEIKAVLSMNDDMAIGCIQAIEAANEKGILVIGFDGNVAALEAIESGSMTATIAQQSYDMGYQTMEQAVKAVNGETIEPIQEVDIVVIDKDNIAEYKK